MGETKEFEEYEDARTIENMFHLLLYGCGICKWTETSIRRKLKDDFFKNGKKKNKDEIVLRY